MTNLIPEGDMESQTGWGNYGTPLVSGYTTNPVYEGNYARSCFSSVNNSGTRNTTLFSLTKDNYYKFSAWFYLADYQFNPEVRI